MSNEIQKLNEQIITLRKLMLDNEKKITELLLIPEVREFYNIFTDNEKIKNTLKAKETQYTLKNMRECKHTFVITEIVRNSECGSIRKTPVYYCVKCGLTNEYDIKEISDLMDSIKSQMAFLFADTFKNGFLLSNEVVSLSDAIEVYKGIINISPNTTNAELKRLFLDGLSRMRISKEQSGPVLTKKLTPPNNTCNK